MSEEKLNKPADASKIRFNRKAPKRRPDCGKGLKDLTLVSVAIECPFKPEEEKLVYGFEVEGFPHEEHGVLDWFGNANGSMGEFKGKKSNNLKAVEAFGLTPDEVEEQGLSPADFIGKQCQGLVTLKKSGDREFPRLTELLAK